MDKIDETISKYGYVNFAPSKDEQWSIYRLEDDDKTIIKQKVVPLKVIKDFDNYVIETTVLTAAFSSKKGEPSAKKIPTEESEIKEVLDKLDIDFTSEEPWNEYVLSDGGRISIKTVATAISSTKIFDKQGEPVFYVNHQILFKKRPPK
jgi:hypothetical protein